MPFKSNEKTQKIVNIQKRVVKYFFLKTGEFNAEIKHVPIKDKTEFNELFTVLQKDFANNNESVTVNQLITQNLCQSLLNLTKNKVNRQLNK